MDDRLAKVEKASEDIKNAIEKKMEWAQQSTQDYIAQSQANFLAKVAEMLIDKDPMKGECLVMDPRAMQKIEDPLKQQGLQVESSSHEGIDVKNSPGDYIVHDLKATG
ncbi:hypothetical protein V6N13_042938 [Hibiscus sabdariffa]